jgi:hypothetical protein
MIEYRRQNCVRRICPCYRGMLMTNGNSKVTFGDVVKVICQYPKMYLMHGTFGEALAFLEGYGKGARLDGLGRSGSFFSPFKEWLCNQAGWKETEDFWRSFRDSYGEDQTALREFARLWSEYEVESHSVNEKSI